MGTHQILAYPDINLIGDDIRTIDIILPHTTCLFVLQEVDNNVMGRQINCVVAHPTLPLTITAHEDRHIRFFDNTTGKLVHSMVAHLDSVTSLAVDPNGLYLLSGSKCNSHLLFLKETNQLHGF